MARRILRLSVAIGGTAYVLWRANPHSVWAACRDANLGWIAIAIALVAADRALMAWRWLDLLGALTPGTRPSFFVVLRIFFVSSFVSNFVPSVAADSYRAVALARVSGNLAESAASVLLDRLLGVLSVVVVSAASLPFAARMGLPDGVFWLLSVTFAGCLAAGSVVFSPWAARTAVHLSRIIPVYAVHRFMGTLVDAVRRYAHHRDSLVRVLVLSILVQVLRVLQTWCLAVALGIFLPAGAYFVFVPLIVLIVQIPITINGLGSAQIAFDKLLVPLGAAPGPVFVLSMLFLVLGVIGTLPGGVMYGFTPHPTRPASVP